MFLPFALVIAIVLFVAQLILCFKGKNNWIKLSIFTIGVVSEGILWLCFLASPDPMMDRGLAFTAYILAAVGLVWIAALVFAWCVYGVVCVIRRRRN